MVSLLRQRIPECSGAQQRWSTSRLASNSLVLFLALVVMILLTLAVGWESQTALDSVPSYGPEAQRVFHHPALVCRIVRFTACQGAYYSGGRGAAD